MIKSAVAICFVLVLISCSGLRKSQVSATENFALATKGISRVPADIYYRIYILKAESQTLQLNTLLATNDNVAESITLLKNDYEEKIKFISLTENYATAYNIVEQYAGLVLCLLKDEYQKEFLKSKATWQTSFEKLIKTYNKASVIKIPSSVGKFTALVVEELGKGKIAGLQKKYLREAIHTARIPFENICDDFITLDSLKIQSEINNLPAFIDNNYANFLENIRAYEKQGNNPYYYYNAYTPIYTGWLNQYGEIKILSKQAVDAFRKLKSTFGILEAYVNSTGKASEVPEVNELMDQYSGLIESYQKFEKRRVKMNAATLLN